MKSTRFRSMPVPSAVNRRDFLKLGCCIGTGMVLGTPTLWAQEQAKPTPPARPKTNIDEALKAPRTRHSLPGPFPGRVVEVHDPRAVNADTISAPVVREMFLRGLQGLTGKNAKQSFRLFFTKSDVVGLKVNPVGPGLISTHLELLDAVIQWLTDNGLPRRNIVIWDRFDYMLKDAGITTQRFPEVTIAGLQTMIEEENAPVSRWQDAAGNHVSLPQFDQNVYYWADVEGPKDMNYLNQHVVNGKHSYFGRLLTQKLTKIINIPVFKNTGNGVSMATKNLGYGAICNTGRLHQPLFFDVCTEVLAFPVLRDKLVLNILDGLRGQYDGGPMPNAAFAYWYNTLFFATDPFAMDAVGHRLMVEKRRAMKVNVNDHPRFTEYLNYAQRLGLGVTEASRIVHVRA